MADKKISDFTAATTLGTGDLFELETAAGNSRKITKDDLATALGGGGYRGALVKKSANQTTANYGAGGAYMTFDTESRDTDGIFDSGVDNTKLNAPSGVTKVRLRAQAYLDAFGTGNAYFEIQKNGSNNYAGVGFDQQPHNSTERLLHAHTAVLDVTGGTDYFQVKITMTADTSITVYAAWTWFEMEIIA